MPPRIRIALFRNDLRLHDQPLLQAAAHTGGGDTQLLPVYCFDPRQVDLTRLNDRAEGLGPFKPARTWHFGLPRSAGFKTRFLVESVLELQKNLQTAKSDLLIRYGEPEKIIPKLIKHLSPNSDAEVELFCQREQTYEETQVENALKKHVKLTLTDGGSTMVHPDDLPFPATSTPRVFTAFRKRVEGMHPMVRDPIPTPKSLPPFPEHAHAFLQSHSDLELANLLGDMKAAYDKRSTIPYKGGESIALERLEHYCKDPLWTYKKTRNALHGPDGSTHFSPFLAVGALSARTVYASIKSAEDAREGGGNQDSYWVIFELLWRDYWKFLARGPMDQDRIFALYGMKSEPGRKHDAVNGEWKQDKEGFQKWKDGMTGVPFVDANMRELTATGYMSNRGRQNVASFIAGQMNIDWRVGAEWFESQLVDHDVCSNYGNWTYAAGVGTDPRAGRSFNILKQAHDYDPKSEYVRLWLPELKDVPDEHVQHPWTWKEAKTKDLGGYPTEPVVLRDEWKRFGGGSDARGGGGHREGGRGRGKGGPRGRGKTRGRRSGKEDPDE